MEKENSEEEGGKLEDEGLEDFPDSVEWMASEVEGTLLLKSSGDESEEETLPIAVQEDKAKAKEDRATIGETRHFFIDSPFLEGCSNVFGARWPKATRRTLAPNQILSKKPYRPPFHKRRG